MTLPSTVRVRFSEDTQAKASIAKQGPIGPIGATGPQGATGAGSAGLRYDFSANTTMADPSQGFIRFSNTDIGNVTSVVINNQTVEGANVAGYISSWSTGELIFKSNEPGDSTYAIFNLEGVDVYGSYCELLTTYIAGTMPSDNEKMALNFVYRGPQGFQGATGLQGATGFTGATGAAGVSATGRIWWYTSSQSDIVDPLAVSGYFEELVPDRPSGLPSDQMAATVNSASGNVYIAGHLTRAGDPGLAEIPAGEYTFRLWRSVSDTSANTGIILRVSEVQVGNGYNKVSFFELNTGDINDTVPTQQSISIYAPNPVPLFDSTSRFLIEHFTYSNSSNNIVTSIWHDGQTQSSVITPIGAGLIGATGPEPTAVIYTANAISVISANVTIGSVTDIQTFGDYTGGAGNGYFQINELGGVAPAYEVQVTFEGVAAFNQVLLHVNYTNTSTHTIRVECYDYVNLTWTEIGRYQGLSNWTQFIFGIIDDANFISAGQAKVRLYHQSTGSSSHQTFIDYVALQKGVTGSQGPRGFTGATGPIGATGATGAQGIQAGNTAPTNLNILWLDESDPNGVGVYGLPSGGNTGQILIKNSNSNYDVTWSANVSIVDDQIYTGNLSVFGLSLILS